MEELYHFAVQSSQRDPSAREASTLKQDSDAVFNFIMEGHRQAITAAAERGLHRAYIFAYERWATLPSEKTVPIDEFIEPPAWMQDKLRAANLLSVSERIRSAIAPFTLEIQHHGQAVLLAVCW